MEKKINDIEFISSEVKKIFEQLTTKDFDQQKELLEKLKFSLRETIFNKATNGCIHCSKTDLGTFTTLKRGNVSNIYYKVLSGANIGIKLDTLRLIFCDKCFIEFKIEERINNEDELKRKREEYDRIEYEKQEREKTAQRFNNLKQYIQTRGSSGFGSPSKAINAIGSSLIPYNEEICQELKMMNYYDYLKTDYWWAVSNYVRYRANYLCSLCKSPRTNIHHKTYEHRGKEHIFMDDLICLCENCHQKQHSIKK